MKYRQLSAYLLASALLFISGVGAFADAPLIQFRPVADPDKPDSEKTTLTRHNATETLSLDRAVVFDQAGIQSATVGKHPDGGPSITITLTETATKQWAEFTAKNVGKRVAILVNGRVIAAPGIREPLLSRTLELAGNMTDMEAAELAKKLNSKPPK